MNRWQTVFAIDSDKWACATYRANFPGVRVECGPVSDWIDRLPRADVVIGGPPCQPFSIAGEGAGSSDERDCIPDFVAAVLKVRPRMFLMENVPGLLAPRHIKHLSRAVQQLEREGYAIEFRELDAVNFGVPQFRNRVWLWGISKLTFMSDGIWFSWPRPTHVWPAPEKCMYGGELETAITVGQALDLEGDLHRRRGKSVERRDHPVDEPVPSITSSFALGGGGGLFLKSARVIGGGRNDVRGADGHFKRHERDITDEPCTTIAGTHIGTHKGAQNPRIVAVDETLDKPCPTISAGSHCGGPEPINNRKREGFIRRLTPLECFRIQSGPDDFVWPEGITKTAMYRIVGNGWASGMARHMSNALARADKRSKTVIDLFCGGGLGAVGWHGRAWEYQAREAVSA